METFKLLIFSMTSLTLLTFTGCSKQAPVIENTEVVSAPGPIQEQQASSMLVRTQNISNTVALIKRRYSENFNWVNFWRDLPNEINFARLSSHQVNTILSLGSESCESKDLDEFGKFSVAMAKVDSDHSYNYLSQLQLGQFSCQRQLNKFQVRQTLSLYNDVLIANDLESTNDKIIGIENTYIDYLRFLTNLDYIHLDVSEVAIISKTPLNSILSYFKTKQELGPMLNLFHALKKISPYKQELWGPIFQALVASENYILAALEKLSLQEVLALSLQMKDLIANNYQIETKQLLNFLLLKKFTEDFTEKKPSQQNQFNLYIQEMSPLIREVFYLQKAIFKDNLSQFLTANDQLNYSLSKAIKGMADIYLQENATKAHFSPYFSYLDNYIRRAGPSSFQKISIQYTEALDNVDQYFLKRLKLEDEQLSEAARSSIFNQLCQKLDQESISEDFNKAGCYQLEGTTLNLSQKDLRVNDHAYIKGFNTSLKWELNSISGGVFNLSAKKEHKQQENVPAQTANDAITIPLIIGFKYSGSNNQSVCFDYGNTYYLPYHFNYRETKSGYLPELFPSAKEGFKGGDFHISLNPLTHSIMPLLIANGGQGQKGASGMPAGKGRRIRYSESKIAFEFFGQMADTKNSFLLSTCRNVDALLHLLANAETGTINGSASKNTYIDLGYLNYLTKDDQNYFENDVKIFANEKANYCQDDECILQALGKAAMQKMMQELLDAQINGAQVNDVMPENKTHYFVEDNSNKGMDQVNGEKGKDGKLKVEYR